MVGFNGWLGEDCKEPHQRVDQERDRERVRGSEIKRGREREREKRGR